MKQNIQKILALGLALAAISAASLFAFKQARADGDDHANAANKNQYLDWMDNMYNYMSRYGFGPNVPGRYLGSQTDTERKYGPASGQNFGPGGFGCPMFGDADDGPRGQNNPAGRENGWGGPAENGNFGGYMGPGMMW